MSDTVVTTKELKKLAGKRPMARRGISYTSWKQLSMGKRRAQADSVCALIL